MLDVLHSERFVDMAPEAVAATLRDEGRYLCSSRTMYRLLAAEGEVHERRIQRRPRAYKRPELLATAPRQTWSWDVSWLRGPIRGTYFYLYTILDLYSRYIVGWTVARTEDSDIAQHLLRETCRKQGIEPGHLTLHADRGAVPKSKAVAQLLEALGVERSLSRPHVSDDNPFSEAAFKTLKYRPDYPDRFLSLEAARDHIRAFVDWYNHHHHHAGIAFLTPSTVHYGHVEQVLAIHTEALDAAYASHPERFVQGPPTARQPPPIVYINPPEDVRKKRTL